MPILRCDRTAAWSALHSHYPPLTTVRSDGTAIGQRAAHLIMGRADGLPVLEPVIDVGFSLARRENV